uniref:Uncharacterized protein n=1 Tax=Ditylenchus dipsaci TaxID=166011 RepID=A0A915E0Q0_9BILA
MSQVSLNYIDSSSSHSLELVDDNKSLQSTTLFDYGFNYLKVQIHFLLYCSQRASSNKTHDLNIPDNVEANWGKGLDSFSDSSEPEDGLQLFFIDRLRLNLPVSFQLQLVRTSSAWERFRTSTPTLMMRKKKSPFQTQSGVLSSLSSAALVMLLQVPRLKSR